MPSVDPTAQNNFAIRKAVGRGPVEVANYLASLPCYNPFAANISINKRNTIIQLLKELKLEHQIVSHRINHNKNLTFL
ncbi:hypothetical protein BN59_00902 [Legionella massiliensis]|uniref:Uncharacterized protein n=1 Tax=Legionella massiliensis TaxID=1034943 RepID=A0A078KY11_9GAMM|nr:hypothetical protein BN59_00902 [Legionella massiliensis]CEE12366.1 hypothetical protein BN1094_00902 [Legionella massiliensis]